MINNLPKFLQPIFINTVKLLKIRHQIHQNIPHHLLHQQHLAKILPLQYFSAYGICIEANCNRMARKFYMEFYGFTVVGKTVKLKSVNVYYHVAKILSCFDNLTFSVSII